MKRPFRIRLMLSIAVANKKGTERVIGIAIDEEIVADDPQEGMIIEVIAVTGQGPEVILALIVIVIVIVIAIAIAAEVIAAIVEGEIKILDVHEVAATDHTVDQALGIGALVARGVPIGDSARTQSLPTRGKP